MSSSRNPINGPQEPGSRKLRNCFQFMVFFFCLILRVFASTPGEAESFRAPDGVMPFVPGEKLTFELKWSMIPAGTAVLEVLPVETVMGREVYHFVMTVKTNDFVDHFYKVRDRIDAYASVNMDRSVLYKKKQREGRSRRDVAVLFDWQKHQAEYSDFGKKNKPITLMPGAFDPYSAFYFIRNFNWQEETEIQRPVTDGKKCIIGRARRIKRETITVPAGTFDTYRIEPDIEHVGGVFEKSRNAKIELWLTADQRRIPVRLRSRVVVGSFTGELVAHEGTVQ
jgi:hypothetical protein